jgi:Family of unknown function (DUF5677)
MIPPTIGFPERWTAFNKRNAAFVSECYPGLVLTSEKLLNRRISIKTMADDIVFLLGRTAFEDYCELWVLAGNAYGVGAFKILRGLYEKVVTLGYLVRQPAEIQRFCDYEIVQKRRLMNRVKKIRICGLAFRRWHTKRLKKRMRRSRSSFRMGRAGASDGPYSIHIHWRGMQVMT